MDQTRNCGWVIFVLTSKLFSGLLLVKSLNSKMKLLLGFFSAIKEKSRFLHILVTAPRQQAKSFLGARMLPFLRVWGCSLLPTSMEFSHKNNVWFLQLHSLPPPYRSVTSLWCLQSARSCHWQWYPSRKTLIVNVSKVIERLSFASKTVQSCVRLSQRRHKLRKYFFGDFMWFSPQGLKFRNPKCWWHHLGFWCLFLFPMQTTPKLISPAWDRARSCSEANMNPT